jgi:hypothetical protein
MTSGVTQLPPQDLTQMLHGMAKHLDVAVVLSRLFHAGNTQKMLLSVRYSEYRI